MLKNHAFGSFILNNSEIFKLSFEDILFVNTRHLYGKNELTLGSSGGGGVHGKVCWLIAYNTNRFGYFKRHMVDMLTP